MQQVVIHGDSSVSIESAPVPTPASGEVVLRMRCSALCGSEMKDYYGKGVANSNGGHEAVGVIETIGPDVTLVAVGDRVGISAVAGCGRTDCEPCNHGQSTWCPDFQIFTGAHAELFKTSETACLQVPDHIPDDIAVLLTGDGLGVPYHTGQKLGDTSNRTIAIFGAGPVGLSNIMVQHFYGARVIAIDISEYRLEQARRLGANTVIDARNADAVAKIHEWSSGGVDIAMECAGNPKTLKQCFNAVRPNGIVMINGEQSAVELSPSEDFIRRDITAIGSWYYQVGEYPRMLELFESGLPLGDLISHRLPFTDAAEGFDLMAKGECAKVILQYPQS